jgi:dihydrofolate reductase
MSRRNVVLSMHTTLDGMADSKTGFVPINDRPYWKELDTALAETGASQVDTLLMGKGTYTQFAGFWPNVLTDPKASKDWRAQAKSLDQTPKVIFSKSLRKATWNNSTIVRGDVGREIARIKRRPGKNLGVTGGVAFPRSLIERDLVDEYLLCVVPIIVGEGRDRLFGPLPRPRNLRHVRSWTFRNGVTLHQLRRES